MEFIVGTFFNNNLNANLKYISESEAIEVVVDDNKPSDNMDNLHELHQLKAKILDQETRLKNQGMAIRLENKSK